MKLSRDGLRRLVGEPTVVDGAPLDVATQLMLVIAYRVNPTEPEDVEVQRRRMEEDKNAVSPIPPPMATERDVLIPNAVGSMRARVYGPRTAKPKPGMLVYFHGGGFVSGSLTTHEEAVKMLAHESGVVTCAVEYRLGPEHRFPAAVDDALAAYEWARARAGDFGADRDRVGVGGDSAGGSLSAVVCHLAKARRIEQPTHQLLIYPAIDWWRTTASHQKFAKGFFLEEERTFWFEKRYLNRIEERDDPRASPIKNDDFSGLAPATIVTAGFDILRDEGKLYAETLERAGVPVDYCVEASLIHGFFNMGGVVELARAANTRIAARIREALG